MTTPSDTHLYHHVSLSDDTVFFVDGTDMSKSVRFKLAANHTGHAVVELPIANGTLSTSLSSNITADQINSEFIFGNLYGNVITNNITSSSGFVRVNNLYISNVSETITAGAISTRTITCSNSKSFLVTVKSSVVHNDTAGYYEIFRPYFKKAGGTLSSTSTSTVVKSSGTFGSAKIEFSIVANNLVITFTATSANDTVFNGTIEVVTDDTNISIS